MPATWPTAAAGGGTRTEADPIAVARLDALDVTFSTDAERAAAVAALQAADALKQDAATASTDAERDAAIAAAIAGLDATFSTDAERNAAIATLTTAVALKQDASTASTDLERDQAIEAHRVDTTDVHGIADSALLLTRDQGYGSGKWTTGRWYSMQGGSTQAAAASDGHILVSPFTVPFGQAFDSIAFQVTTAGEAGSLIDLALVDDVNSYMGGILNLWAAIAGTAGAKQCDLPAPRVATKTLYWIAARFYNAPTTRPTVRSAPSPQFGMSSANGQNIGTLGNADQGYDFTGFAATPIPDPFPANTAPNPSTLGLRVSLRAA